jgi:hypothetical protein
MSKFIDIRGNVDSTDSVIQSDTFISMKTNSVERILIAADGDVVISSTSTSSDATTGALVVSGGLGVADNINVLGASNLVGQLTLGDGGTSYDFPTTKGLEGEILSISGNSLVFGSGGSNSVTALTDFGTDNRMVKTVGINKEIEATGVVLTDSDGMDIPGASTISATLRITDTTVSSSPITGALVVNGGVGIGEDLYVNNNIDVSGTADITGVLTLGTGGTAYSFPSTVGVTGELLTVSGGNLVFSTGISSGTGGTTISGDTTITSTTVSSSATSGALVVSGGLGVAGDVFIDDTLNVTGVSNLTTVNATGAATFGSTMKVDDLTQSNDCSTGALVVSGGVGVGRNLNVCGTFAVDGDSTMTGQLVINDATNAVSDSTGALVVLGGLAVTKDVVIGGSLTVNGTTTVINSTVSSLMDPIIKYAAGNTADTVDFGFYGEYDINTTAKYAGLFRDSADSKWKLFVDTQVEPTDPGQIDTNATGYTAATMVLGALETGTIDTSGIVNINDVTNSVSIASGALVVDGGVGIAMDLFVGGTTDLVALNASGASTFTSTLAVTDSTTSADTVSGAVIVTGGVGIGENLNVGGTLDVTGTSNLAGVSADGASTFSSTLAVTDATSSADTTSGALIVTGGVGIAENLNVGGTFDVTGVVSVTDATSSTTPATGALLVTGGVGIGENLNVGGSLKVTGRTAGNVRTTAVSTSLDADYILNVTATSTVTLPDITNADYDGVTYIVVKQTADTVTVTTQAADKILSGGSEIDSVTLAGASGERLLMVSNGTNWLPM